MNRIDDDDDENDAEDDGNLYLKLLINLSKA
jgi:hypothetical protein